MIAMTGETKKQQTAKKSTLFSKGQVEIIQKLISQIAASQTNSMTAAPVAQKGNFSIALSSQKEKKNQWIINSEASDHMTGNADLFHNYSLYSENFRVCIADGFMSKVAGIGSICLTKDLILKSVLLVPNLTRNLLSISKLSRDLNCVTNFYSTHCEF